MKFLPKILLGLATITFLTALAAKKPEGGAADAKTATSQIQDKAVPVPSDPALKVAYFAAGCFWCVETAFEDLKGVKEVVSGYTGGHVVNPTYEQVGSGRTGHREAVRVVYDPKQISYQKLLDVFWRNFDPTDAGGSFVDRGEPYMSGIFVLNDEEQKLAEESKKALDAAKIFPAPIVTPIFKAKAFYDAEDYHQDYYKKNPIRYKYYRFNSGRDQYLKTIWK